MVCFFFIAKLGKSRFVIECAKDCAPPVLDNETPLLEEIPSNRTSEDAKKADYKKLAGLKRFRFIIEEKDKEERQAKRRRSRRLGAKREIGSFQNGKQQFNCQNTKKGTSFSSLFRQTFHQ